LLLIVVVEIKENDYSISGFYPVFQVFTLCFRFLPCLFQVFTLSISGFYPVYFRFQGSGFGFQVFTLSISGFYPVSKKEVNAETSRGFDWRSNVR